MASTETKSPAELRAERFERLRAEWNRLSGRVNLGHLNDAIEDMQGEIEGLVGQIEGFRGRGYVYSRDWEARAAAVQKGWPQRKGEARRILTQQMRRLEAQARVIDGLCARTRLGDAELDRLESELDQLESQVSSAESSVRGAYDSLSEQTYELGSEFRRVAYLLDSLDTASFPVYPDEHGVAACEAIWVSGRDEPEGILFLTEGRLIFERREKVAKKKVLFVTTSSELVQEKLWEAPIGMIAELEAEDKRKFLSKRELLHLRFREPPERLAAETSVRLKGATNEEWSGLIKRVQSGEIEAERFDAPAPGADEVTPAPEVPPQEIPTKCPACGARLPVLVKGMRELICEYCDTVVRL